MEVTMSEEIKVQYLLGNDTQQEELIDFINYVFHMNGKDNDFYRALPKIYKKEYHPCEYNYLALEDNRIKAAVGAFPGEVTICGTTLSYIGIGNVAVNPYSRSKGYMKKLMDLAVDQILQEDVDFSVLSGRRNRYSYFSYEVTGRKYCLWMDESNVKHSFPKDRNERFQFVQVNENDVENLQKINDLQIIQPLHYKRETNKLFDILKNWHSVDIYSIFEESRFAGYLLFYDKINMKEIVLHKQEDISEVIADFINIYKKDGINIELADYQRFFIDSLSTIAETVNTQAIDNFSILHYGKVIEALLRLKAQTDKLADGKVTLYIHGKKMDEKLLITVKENQVSVTNTDDDADYEFSHLEAMSVLLQNYSSLRNKMPFEVQTWFPLPIHIFPADQV
jgi:predicted N-acetyltransferase YhbS